MKFWWFLGVRAPRSTLLINYEKVRISYLKVLRDDDSAADAKYFWVKIKLIFKNFIIQQEELFIPASILLRHLIDTW